jgi:phosphoserine phosphatase
MALNIENVLKRIKDSSSESYYGRYNVLKERLLETEYTMTMAGFPGGNDHGPSHIKRVLINLDKLLGKSPLRHLSPYELFLAMMAVLYHDVGILRGRKEHAATSARLLSAEKENYIFDETDKFFISAIVLSHSSTVDISLRPEDQPAKGYDVRPRLLCALVRLADELDEDVRRADPLLREKLDLPKESKFYWRFNERIRGIKIDRSSSEIVFNVAFAKDDIAYVEEGMSSSFIELCFKKIVKVNRERVYCNQYLPSPLAMQRIKIMLQPVEGISRFTELVLTDLDDFETIKPLIPPSLLTLQTRTQSRRQRKTRRIRRDDFEPAPEAAEAVVNAYKLFFHRTTKQLSIKALAEKSKVAPWLINSLEKVADQIAPPNCFNIVNRAVLSRLEHALGVVGKLEYGQPDDLLAAYLMYYKVNHLSRHGLNRTGQLNFAPDTKAVVFDFGGTLTKPKTLLSTWERMWLSVGYTIEDAGKLHRLFTLKKISHQAWCDRTCEKLRAKQFSREHMRSIISDIEPVDDLKSTLLKLYERGIRLYVVSGSIREIIVSILGEAFTFLTEMKANDLLYDSNGIINEIRGHPFDFEGKAKFIARIVEELKCSPLEVLFVGNSLNDTWASQSGARTLCVNPTHVDFTNTHIWGDYIKEMRSLSEVLPFAERNPT